MNTNKIFLIVIMMISLVGCEKYLGEKSDKRLAIPSSLRDLQSLLDNSSNVNGNTPGAGDLAADEYYLLYDTWVARSETDQRGYIWEPDYSTAQNNWFPTYRVIYYTNIVLEKIESIERTSINEYEWNNVKGQAHFLRAKSFLHIANIWSLAYDEGTASTDLGIPLRLGSDFNIPSIRSSLGETYSQIISDLEAAVSLLPLVSRHPMRPSKTATFALLARVSLFMRNYERCLHYANQCLDIQDKLIDYNDLDPTQPYPIPQFNPEILYHSVVSPATNSTINVNNALADTILFHLYSKNDLRRTLFFRMNNNDTYSIRGNYSGDASRFSGIAIDEVYLMRAECLVRQGDLARAMDGLNHLLENRYIKGTYTPLEAGSPEQALQYILVERRKQLLMRGLRFPDVKRLNKEGAGIGFKRVLDGNEYYLPPNDLRFALAIPESVIELAPNILPNPR